MKFVNVQQAKNLKVGTEAYTLNDQGEYGVGKLNSRSEDVNGLKLVFEVPQYTSTETPPPLKPLLVDNITHVCVMKNRTAKEGSEVTV